MACLPNVGDHQEALQEHLAPETMEIISGATLVAGPLGLETFVRAALGPGPLGLGMRATPERSLVRFTEDTLDSRHRPLQQHGTKCTQ